MPRTICGSEYTERDDSSRKWGWLRFINPIFAVLSSEPIRYTHALCTKEPGHPGPHEGKGLEWEDDKHN